MHGTRHFLLAALPLILLVAALPVASCAAADPYADARRAFLDARAQATTGRPAMPAPDSDALRAYPLYPYLEAARLQRRFADPAAAAEIEAFLQRHGDQPVARSLRRSWLMELALRRQWSAFLAAYRPELDDTLAARCGSFSARLALGRLDGLADNVTAQYALLLQVDALGVDWTTDLGDARRAVLDRVALQGNLDPSVLYAPPAQIRAEVAKVLASFGRGHGHVFNLGHGIHPEVRPEHALAMVEAVHELSPAYHQSGDQ